MFTLQDGRFQGLPGPSVARLIVGGYSLLDTQFVTDHLSKFGTLEISQSDYNNRLGEALKLETDFYALSPQASGQEVLTILDNWKAR